MIDPLLLVVLVLFSSGVCQLTASPWFSLCFIIVTVPGMVILLNINLGSVGFAFAGVLASLLLFMVCRPITHRRVFGLLPYSLLLLVFVPDLIRISSARPLFLLGTAFIAVRLFVTVKECLKEKSGLGEVFLSLILATFFFPSIFVGPIFSGRRVYQQLRRNEPALIWPGLYRLLEGFVFLAPVSYYVAELRDKFNYLIVDSSSPWIDYPLNLLALPVISFVFIYTTFFGYSRISEGTALLFGFQVPENFNRPWLAKDFADFWKRWHRSMADFVLQYIYLPLSIYTRKPKFAMVVAFVGMGIWHHVSPGYILWGILHGLALGWLTPYLNNRQINPWIMRLITLFSVVMISYLANHWVKQILP